jgi:GntR family transcriptional repressor for pyruvate dehydrogenase complex
MPILPQPGGAGKEQEVTAMGERRSAASLAGIRPVSSRRLSEQVAGQIRGLITQERLAEGDRLPPERDLAQRFGVSRPMVSQALRMLSLMGLVDIRQGSGAYVLRRPQDMVAASVSLMLDLDQGPLGDLAELRLWLETLGATQAAERGPVPELSGSLRRLAGATGSAAAWIAADTVFHADVVRAAGNAYLTALYEGVHTAVLSREHDLWVRTEQEPGWLAGPGGSVLLDIHQAIYDAVAVGDADRAQAAVLRHHEVMLAHLAAAREGGQGAAGGAAAPGQPRGLPRDTR